MYMLAGQYVSSPALGSAGVLMKKVCYGLALPGLLVTCIILIHVRSHSSLPPLDRSLTEIIDVNRFLGNTFS